MKKEQLIGCCATFVITLLLLTMCNQFLQQKDGQAKNMDFYKQEEDFDVLFLGSSHMIMDISPIEIWNDYGIISYNLGNYGQWLPGDYWILRSALQYTTPDLVVVDVYAICKDEMNSPIHKATLHNMLDPMLLSSVKINAITDLMPKENRLEFFVPYSLYHQRWDGINSTFFVEPSFGFEKGAENTWKVQSGGVLPPTIIDSTQVNNSGSLGREYLIKIIELCQENNIEILLIALPFAADENMQEWMNSAYGIAESYDINYLDLLRQPTGINYLTDMYDAGHLNSSGAYKISKIVGAYITEHYDFPYAGAESESLAKQWNLDWEHHMENKIALLSKESNLENYLMRLMDSDFRCQIYLKDENILLGDNWLKEFTDSISVEYRDEPFDSLDADIQISVSRVDSGEIVDYAFFDYQRETAYVRR